MSVPECADPAAEVVLTLTAVLREAFDPDGPCGAPEGGGTTVVRFFASDGGVIWDAKCAQPHVWVRVDRRYRSRVGEFPRAFVGDDPCGSGVLRVLAVEVGVARCSSADAAPKWDKLEREAQVSLDDSWRIESALCGAVKRLRRADRAVATDTVAPVGPEGGLIAWTGMVYVQL